MSVTIATCQVATLNLNGDEHICTEPQVAVADVPLVNGEVVELPLCAEHLRVLHASRDLVQTARRWLS